MLCLFGFARVSKITPAPNLKTRHVQFGMSGISARMPRLNSKRQNYKKDYVYMYVCICICICICVCVHISLSLSLYIYIYIYIHICTHILKHLKAKFVLCGLQTVRNVRKLSPRTFLDRWEPPISIQQSKQMRKQPRKIEGGTKNSTTTGSEFFFLPETRVSA